jgi:hypothetical protein
MTCTTAAVGANLGYDQTIDRSNRATLAVPVHQRFGPGGLPSAVGPLDASQLVAMPIMIDTAGCNLVSLGITALSASKTTGFVGLYDDAGLGPRSLLVSAPWTTPDLSEETAIEHPVLPAEIQPGKYWVAVITSGMLLVDGEGTGPAVVVNDAGATLPPLFPTTQMLLLGATIGFHATVAPP